MLKVLMNFRKKICCGEKKYRQDGHFDGSVLTQPVIEKKTALYCQQNQQHWPASLNEMK